MRFFTRLLIVLIWIVGLSIIAIWMPSTTAVKYSLLGEKPYKDSLLKNTPSPRLIFIGGSTLSFGLDSRMIKDAMHVNPVNTGLEATIGLKYTLRNAVKYLKAGDVVVVCIEYHQYYNKFIDGQYELLPIVFDFSPDTRQLLDARQYRSLLTYMPSYIASKLNPLFYLARVDTNYVGVYNKKAFNAYGDVSLHWTLPSEQFTPYGEIEGDMDDEIFTEIKKFEAAVKQKKATLLITYPAYQKTAFAASAAKINVIPLKLKEHGLNVIGSPESYLFPDSMMYNTSYHLNRKGVTRWTHQMINNLTIALKQK